MPILVFWLTPVVIAVVVVLFLLGQRKSDKPRLFLVEPLFFLVKRWQLARFEGSDKELRRLLADWLPGLELDQSMLEQLTRQVQAAPPLVVDKDLAVISQQALPFWGEARQIERSGKKTWLLAGPTSEVVEYCDVDASGALDRERRDGWRGIADKAHQNGFLALALAESGSSDPVDQRRFIFKGLAILEPELNKPAAAKLRQMAGWGKLRYLTFLPLALANHLLEQVFPGSEHAAVTGSELKTLSPKEQEKKMETATMFAEMDTTSRYWIAKHLRGDHRLFVCSKAARDNDLPSDERV